MVTLVCEHTGDVLYKSIFNVFFEINVQTVSKLIERTLDIFERLFYSKQRGKFISKQSVNQLAYTVFNKYTKPTDECCVCYEKAIKRTHCMHRCCHKCLVKLKVCSVCGKDLY